MKKVYRMWAVRTRLGFLSLGNPKAVLLATKPDDFYNVDPENIVEVKVTVEEVKK